MSTSNLPLRPELIGQQPYGAPQLDVAICLNVNENPYPPSPSVQLELQKALCQEFNKLNRYPDREATQLRSDLANYLGYGLCAAQIWVANGSNEIMIHLLSAFGGPGRKVLTFSPTYSMYPEYARNTYTEYIAEPRSNDFKLSATDILVNIEKHQPTVVILTTPNNPTGTTIDLDIIDQVCTNTEAIIIVDEAYQEFSDSKTAISLLKKHSRLVVCRTMSKAFALAGGRVGYLAADSAIVDACRIVRLPYHMSTQTQTIARVCLKHADEMLAKVSELRDECKQLQKWFVSHGFAVVESKANFCLFGKFIHPEQVWQSLLEKQILVRNTGLDGYLRVSVGTKQEMQIFRDALISINPERQL